MPNHTDMEPAKKIRVMIDARVTAEFEFDYIDQIKIDANGDRRFKTPQEMAVTLEEKCTRFHEFIRDHRSQDPVRLSVERVYQDQCSACRATWELCIEDGVQTCANCGMEVSHA